MLKISIMKQYLRCSVVLINFINLFQHFSFQLLQKNDATKNVLFVSYGLNENYSLTAEISWVTLGKIQQLDLVGKLNSTSY